MRDLSAIRRGRPIYALQRVRLSVTLTLKKVQQRGSSGAYCSPIMHAKATRRPCPAGISLRSRSLIETDHAVLKLCIVS